MKAMLLDAVCDLSRTTTPLRMTSCPVPAPGDREILIKVAACGVCHTELDEIEGRTPPAHFSVILGHQVVGTVVENGRGAKVLHISG